MLSSKTMLICLSVMAFLMLILPAGAPAGEEGAPFGGAAPVDVQPGTRASGSTYHAETIFTDTKPILGGIQVADADGNGHMEVLTAGVSARLYATWWDSGAGDWTSEMLYADDDQLVDLEVAEVNPDSPGTEILVGGYSNNLTQVVLGSDILGGGATVVSSSTIWTGPNHIYGIDSGDVNLTNDVNEVVVVDRLTVDVTVLSWNGTMGVYDHHTMNLTRDTGEDERLTQLAVGDADPDSPGDEIIALGFDGAVHLVDHNETEWTHSVIWEEPGAGLRTLLSTAIGEFDETHPGDEVVVVGWTGNVTMLYKEAAGGNWTSRLLWTSDGSLEGLAIGNFDPLLPGNEILIGGYTNTAAVVHGSGDNWSGFSIYKDPEATEIGVTRELSGAALGDFYPEHDGVEVLLCSSSGKVFMLHDEEPGFTLSTPSTTKSAYPGQIVTFPIVMSARGGFDGAAELYVQTPTVQFDVTYQSLTVTVAHATGVNIIIGDMHPGLYDFQVKGTNTTWDLNHTLTVYVNILEAPTGGEEFQKNVTISAISVDDLKPEPGDTIALSVTLTNSGPGLFEAVFLRFYAFGITILETNVTVLPNSAVAVNATWVVPEGEYELDAIAYIEGENSFNIQAGGDAKVVAYEDEDGGDDDEPVADPMMVAVVLVLLFAVIFIFARWFSFGPKEGDEKAAKRDEGGKEEEDAGDEDDEDEGDSSEDDAPARKEPRKKGKQSGKGKGGRGRKGAGGGKGRPGDRAK